MQELQEHLSRLCTDLIEIENELELVARSETHEPICEQELLAQVRAAVDRVRHLLWPHAEARNHGGGVDEALQRYRMQRVRTMLEDLTARLAEHELADVPEAQTFFTSIQEIATMAVERHLQQAEQGEQPCSRQQSAREPRAAPAERILA